MTDKDYQQYKLIIARFKEHYPDEWATWEKLIREKRSELNNDFGAMKGEAFRFSANIPARLDFILRAFTQGEMHREDYLSKDFFEMFPIFKVAKKL